MEDNPTDADLTAQSRSGNKEAFGLLVERYQQMAVRIARGVVADPDVARELAQEAMVQAYLSLDRLRDGSRFQSWLYGIVLNVCRSHHRDRKTAMFSLEAMVGGLSFDALPFTSVEPAPQEVVEAQELHETVLRAVNALSPRNRAATLLFYYEQLSVREIAATLGVSLAAVKGRLHKSRVQLRELLLPEISGVSQERTWPHGRNPVVKVTIADVVQHGRKDGEDEQANVQSIVVLLDQEGRRVLPVWMGSSEAAAIAMGLREFEVPRPLTHSFTASLLEAADVGLEEVRVEALKGDTFYAVAKLRSGDTVREVDARPSDAIALAVRTGSPIYVAEDVMERAGIQVPDDVGEQEPSGRGIDSFMEEIEKQTDQWFPGSDPSHTEEDVEKRKREYDEGRQRLVSFLFD